MRTTVDIPDETYRELKVKAAREGKSVRHIVLRAIHRELELRKDKPTGKAFRVPVIRSSRPGTLHLTNEQIDDILASS